LINIITLTDRAILSEKETFYEYFSNIHI